MITDPRPRPRQWRYLLAALLNVLVPGAGTAVVHRSRDWWAAVGLFAGVLLVAVTWLVTASRRDLLHVALSPSSLLTLACAAVVLGAVHSWSVLEGAGGLRWRDGWWAKGVATVLALMVLVTYSWGASLALSQRNTVLRVFSGPLTTESSGQAQPSATYRQAGTVQAKVHRGEMTFLLLGGDGGKGRWSRRTDTMLVVRADLDTGALAFVSVPRNLVGLPFPEGPLKDAYPRGFNDLANAVYVRISARPELVGNVPEPGIEALRLGISELTGWTIDHYLLVDLEGFVRMVDALGGVDLVATSNVSPTGKLPGSSRQVGGFRKGEKVHLDGEQALAYARSRTGTSDYARMRRQRCVVAELLRQSDPLSLLANLNELQTIAQRNVLTDVPLSKVPDLIDALSLMQRANAASLLLMPPTIAPSHWKLDVVRKLVQDTWGEARRRVSRDVVPPTTSSAPAISLAPGVAPGRTSTTTSTAPVSAGPATSSPIEDLATACSLG